MNYEKIAEEVDKAYLANNRRTVPNIIERACLEAQLEVLKEIFERKDTIRDWGTASAISEVREEIEAKLKAMK